MTTKECRTTRYDDDEPTCNTQEQLGSKHDFQGGESINKTVREENFLIKRDGHRHPTEGLSNDSVLYEEDTGADVEDRSIGIEEGERWAERAAAPKSYTSTA